MPKPHILDSTVHDRVYNSRQLWTGNTTWTTPSWLWKAVKKLKVTEP